jgi:hypothetical protein
LAAGEASCGLTDALPEDRERLEIDTVDGVASLNSVANLGTS